MRNTPKFNKILLDRVPFRRFRTLDGREGGRVDPKTFAPIIEELISFSALKIIIPSDSVVADFVEFLPPLLKEKTKIAEIKEAENIRRIIFKPLAEEFNLEFEPNIIKWPSRLGRVGDSIGSLYKNILPFLIGMIEEAQVDNSIIKIKDDARAVRLASHSSSSREILSILEGVLNSYQTQEISCLELIPTYNPELIESFHQIINDEKYIELSHEVHSLSLTDRLANTLGKIRRLIVHLTAQNRFKAIWGQASRNVKVAGVSLIPDPQSAIALFGKSYLPSLVPIRTVVDSAMKEFEFNNSEALASSWEPNRKVKNA